MLAKALYNTTLSLVISPCNHFLVAGNIYGDISVYLMKDIFVPKEDCGLAEKKPKRVITAPNNEKICSLAASKNCLIAGTVGEIFAWNWSSLPKKDLKIAWNITIPHQSDSYDKPDVNALVICEETSPFLFVGCGDKRVYMFSLEDGREIRAFEGHTDFIHGLSANGDGEVVSCGDDGQVMMWDVRKASIICQLTPHSQDSLARPHLGKWVADCSALDNKLVCGGGPRAALWDLRRLGEGTPLSEMDDRGVHMCRMTDGHVVVGGLANGVRVFNPSGDLLTKLPSSSPVVYSAAVLHQPSQILCYGGASNHVDVCRNFKSRCHILTVITD